MEKMKKEILEAGRVTSELKHKYFYGLSFVVIRNKLEEMGLDRHMPIEIRSTEIALLTPFGVMMQIRPCDRNQLGCWGGALDDGEEPEEGAIREFKEETGILIDKNRLEFLEVYDHFHEYANQDKAYFKTYRYVIKFNQVPKIVTDEESAGVVMVAHTILNDQQNFIKRLLGEK